MSETVQQTNTPPAPGDLVDVRVERMAYEGKAVAFHEGLVVFVPGGAPGDHLRVRIRAVRERYLEADLVEILEAGPGRVEPKCPYFLRCGGCHLQHLSAATQAEVKRGFVRDALERIGRFRDIDVLPTLADPDPWAYRNKMNYHARLFREGFVMGLYDWPTEGLVDLETCPIQAPSLERVMGIIRDHLREAWERGVHGKIEIGLRGDRAPANNVLVLTHWKQPEVRLDALAEKLDALAPETGPWSVIDRQDIKGGGSVYRTVSGDGYNVFETGGVKLRLAPQAFAQVNLRQAGVLLDTIESFADLRGTETVMDAYCGMGFIGLRLARTAGEVLGVESSPEAVRDAEINARHNGLTNIQFVRRDVGKALRGRAFGDRQIDLVVVDPPRDGLLRKTLETFIGYGIPRLIYVSCNPATLARDLRILADGGYQIRRVQPIDMFPQTYHVETVTELVRAGN